MFAFAGGQRLSLRIQGGFPVRVSVVAMGTRDLRDGADGREKRPCVSFLVILLSFVPSLCSAQHGLVSAQLELQLSQNIELRGHVGGACRAVAVEGQRLLIGRGPRLTSVDLTDPTQPKVRDSILLTGMVADISSEMNVVAVLAGGLWVVDALDFGALDAIGYVPLSGRRLCLSDRYAYIAGSHPDVQVVNLRRPTAPGITCRFNLPREFGDEIDATDIVVRGRYAYVSYIRRRLAPGALTEGGFAILDVLDAKSVRLITDYRLVWLVRGLALEDDRVYLASDDRLMVVDVTDVREPDDLGWVRGPKFPVDICVDRNRIFVITDESAVWVYAAGPGTGLPEKILTATIRGKTNRLAIEDDLVLAATGWAGLRVLRFEDVPKVYEIGSLDAPSEVSDIAVVDNYAYVADGRSGLRVFDLTDPDRPEETQQFGTYDSAVGIGVNGSQLYVVEQVQGLKIYDITQSGSPMESGSLFTGGRTADVEALGPFALVADGLSGLLLIRTTDPHDLSVFGRFDASAMAVATTVTRAFVSDQSQNLWVVDIRSPGFPVAAGRLKTGAPVSQIGFNGERLALAEAAQGLRIVDVDGNGRPRTVSTVRENGSFEGVVYEGNLAYVADANFGLRVYSVLDPLRPSEAGFIATPGQPRRVAVANGRIYLAAGEGGLYVLRYRWSPDLVVRGLDFEPQDVVAGDEVQIVGEIFNNATTPTTTGAWVDLVVSKEPDFRKPHLRLAPRLRIPPGFNHLAPIDLAQQRFTVLKTVPDGAYVLGIVVDADNEVAEFSEHNNVTWFPRKRLYLGPRPSDARRWQQYR